MDVAADEKDVRLQKASAELIADLDTSLKPFLWRTDEAGVLSLRRNVHTRELGRLINLVGVITNQTHSIMLIMATVAGTVPGRSSITGSAPSRHALHAY